MEVIDLLDTTDRVVDEARHRDVPTVRSIDDSIGRQVDDPSVTKVHTLKRPLTANFAMNK